ncbi:MAG: phosphate/phosphite/phosphonate ABC transporter substrate-binding protein, partial [Nitrospirota bacterium]
SSEIEPLKIGVASMITPVDSVKYYQEIIEYVGERIGRPVKMVLRRSYAEMDTMLEKDEVQVAFICSGPYVWDHDKFGVELLVAPSVNGKATYNSYIVVHKDSSIKSLSELKGKRFAFTDPKSNTGKLYTTYRLTKMRYTPEIFFKRFIYSYSHNKSIELVSKKVVDGASVDGLVYDYMLKKDSPYTKLTKIIEKSPPFGMPPVVVTKNIDPSLKAKLREAFLNMHNDPKGKAILDAMMIERFVLIAHRDYNSIRDMEKLVRIQQNIYKVTPEKRNVLRFSVIPRDNPRISYEKYQPFLDYLSEKTSYSYELVLRRNYEDTVTDLGNGTIDIALLGPISYLEAHAKYGVICILKPITANSSAQYKSVIVVKKDSSIENLFDLKGKSFAFASLKSTSGNLIPRYLLADSGIHINDLKKFANFNYHDSVVKAVLRGQFDAGSVKDSVADKYIPLGLKVIASSDPIPSGPIVIGPKTPSVVAEAIKRALLSLDPDDRKHKKILKRWDEDFRYGFTTASDKDYEGVRKMINSIPKTCGWGCHPKTRL